MAHASSPRHSVFRHLFVALCWTAVSLAVASLRIWNGAYDTETLRYADNGQPMITAVDGFYYLALAREHILTGTQAPTLSLLTAWLYEISSFSLETVAFWLPLCFALGMGIWYAGWGWLLRTPPFYSGLAACIGTLIPAWVERSRIGWYDTDPGIAFLWNGCLFATAYLGLPQRRFFPGAAVLLLVCGVLLALWWRPGAILLPTCLLLWGATFIWAHSVAQARVRLIVALWLVLSASTVMLSPENLLPPLVVQLRNYALDHAALVLGTKSGVVYSSIAELSPPSLNVYTTAVGGSLLGGLLALAATAIFCLRRPEAAVFLLPGLGTLLLGLHGERFLYLAALPLAFAVALLPQSTPKENKGHPPFSRRRMARFATGMLGVATIGGSMLYWQYNWMPDGYFHTKEDRVAVALRRVSRPETPVWNWWDDGYFLRARAQMRPLFDGGSQSPDLAWTAAHPLASSDPLLARRWIRFFALRGGLQALEPLRAAWGQEEQIWNLLEKIFSTPDPRNLVTALPPLSEKSNTLDWLFPRGRVFLYLPQRFLQLSQWWIPLGLQRHPDAAAMRPSIDAFENTAFRYDPHNSSVTLPEAVLRKGYTHVGAVFNTGEHPLGPPWGGNAPEPYVVTSPLSPFLYIVDKKGLSSVAFRLLAPGGAPLPGFRPVAVDFSASGAWEVLP